MSSGDAETRSRYLDALTEQVERLCREQDHISDVIGSLGFPENCLSDTYTRDSDRQYDFESILRVLLYQEVSDFTDQEVANKLRLWPYVQMRFGLNRQPTGQTLSYTRRNRLEYQDKVFLSKLVDRIEPIADEHGLVDTPDESPPIKPSELSADTLTVEEMRRAVKTARDRGLSVFQTNRAENAKYEDEVFWEMQAYLAMVGNGKTGMDTIGTLFSWRDELPHPDTHTRTIKKLGRPDPQLTLPEFDDGTRPQKWKRIRKILLEPFDAAIANLIEETDFKESLKEPVNVAIDVTPWEFHPSPWKHRPLDILKEDYPSMVSGLKDKHKRGYKFATLTIVGRDTPIILAIEPVKENSFWETNGDRTPIADVVDRLISKAKEHVDVNKVFADREFDTYDVRGTLHQHGVTYLIPKRLSAKKDLENVEDIKQHPNADCAVEHDVTLTSTENQHSVDLLYVPSKGSSDSYAIFTTNADISVERIESITAQYRDRWTIENEYKSIKHNFLPQTCSTDYRVRLFTFVAGVLMYNTWRLTNLILRHAIDADLGESPPLSAGELSQLLGCHLDETIG